MPKGLRILPISFEEQYLTHFAGMLLIQRFCQKLGIKHLLQQHLLRPAPRFRDFQTFRDDPGHSLCHHRWDGAGQRDTDPPIQRGLPENCGLSRFPDQTAIRRFLKRLTPKQIRQIVRVHDLLRKALFDRPYKRTSMIFDLDSTVLVVYGKSVEGVAVGYNPKKHGRRSYHPPWLSSPVPKSSGMVLLRPGDAGSSTGAVPFIKVCLAKVPKRIPKARIRFRMDSGFYGKRVVEFLDEKGHEYVIVAQKSQKARPCHSQSPGLQIHTTPKRLER